MLDERNVQRTWERLRRRAQDPRYGVRPLGLHSARHTFASLALDSGRSIRFVAEQLGHNSPPFTLETDAHMLPMEGDRMGFADFRRPSGVTKRHYASPDAGDTRAPESPEPLNTWAEKGNLERETRFELATLSLGS